MGVAGQCIAVDVDASLTLDAFQHGDRSCQSVSVTEVIAGGGKGTFTAGVFVADGEIFHLHGARRVVPDEAATSLARCVRVQAAAANRVMPTSNAPVHLMTSLPMRDYFAQNNAASELVDQVQASIGRPVNGETGTAIMPPYRVQVLPRTVAAFMDWAFDPEGQLLPAPQGVESVVVVDIAHGGTTLAAFDATSQEVVHESRVEIPLGWGGVLVELGRQLAHQHQLQDLPVRAAVHALLSGQYHRRGAVWSCASVLETAFSALAAEVQEAIEQLSTRCALRDVSLLLSGAGAMAFGRALGPRWSGLAHVPDAPEHCNARGMHKFGLLAMRENL